MKTLSVICVLLCVSAARAEWHELQTGLDESGVVQRVGMPLQMNRSRSGAQVTWTYDLGAYVQFENRRVSHWHGPRSGAKALVAGVQRPAVAKMPAQAPDLQAAVAPHTCQLCGRAHLVQTHRSRM